MKNLKEYISKKESITPVEVATLLIYDWVDEFRQIYHGIYKPRKMITEEILDLLVSKMNEEDLEEGKKLLDIKEWISKNYPIASAHIQQAQGNLNELLKEVASIEAFESIGKLINELPLIMTEKQYRNYAKLKYEKLIDSKDLFSFMEIMGNGINFYLEMLRESPRRKNPLRALKKIYLREKLEHNHIFKNENMKKWDFLNVCDISNYYKCFERREIASLKEFKSDFMDLYNTMEEDIKRKLDIKTENIFKKVYTLEELHDKKIYNFDIFPSSEEIENYKNLKNGIAIIEEETLSPIYKDQIKNGRYETPKIYNFMHTLGIYAYSEEEGKRKIKERAEDYEAIKESYYFIQGYNKAIKIIMEKYNLKEIEVFLAEQSQIDFLISQLNTKILLLSIDIEKSKNITKEAKQEKLKIFNNVFKTIHTSDLQTSKKNINKFLDFLNKGKVTADDPEAINTMAEWIFK